ncbi:hypothetical protein [Massilia sp. DD77]|uniref:hypothetical protein n=1 Tax=Massilia sp. DD77 TaxID=3109349 RepID=UPI002FFD6C33
MRTPTLATAQYKPDPVPSDPKEFARYLDAELHKIAAVLTLVAAGHIDKVFAEPAKPRDGDLRYADGTEWNPGSGEGIYRFNGTTWIFLG